MLIETFKTFFFLQYLFTELGVVNHFGTFTDLIIKLLEEISGRISIDV